MTAQLALGLRNRDAGESSALSALSADTVKALTNALASFAAGKAFTSDMVWDALSFTVRESLALHPNAVGALFTSYAKKGLIERTGASVRSQRKHARGRRLPLWRWK